MRLALAVTAWLGAVLITAWAWAQPEHVRVVWTEDPGHRAVVLWTTQTATASTLHWDTEPRGQASHYREQAVSTAGLRAADDAPHYVHRAAMTGLSPGELVHFRVAAEAGVSRELWFRAAPTEAAPFALLAGGDSRSDSRMRRQMNLLIRDLVADEPAILALAHGGDYIARGSSWTQWRRWLDDWDEAIGADGRVLPIIPTRGNHEGDGELYNVMFGAPGASDAEGDWFVTRIGQDFALVTLDTNVSLGGAQRAWLDATLMGLQDLRWIAVSYHRPAYPAVKSPGEALEHWVPLFEHYNIDFALESDGHVLKRTVPIRSGQPDPTGVVYLGEGGLGVPQRTPDRSRWYLEPPGMAMSSHHVQLLQVYRDKIVYSAIDPEREVMDRYEFEPRRPGQAGSPPSIQAPPVTDSPPAASVRSVLRCATAPAAPAQPALWFSLLALCLVWVRRLAPSTATRE